jgi:hypothetical protein
MKKTFEMMVETLESMFGTSELIVRTLEMIVENIGIDDFFTKKESKLTAIDSFARKICDRKLFPKHLQFASHEWL